MSAKRRLMARAALAAAFLVGATTAQAQQTTNPCVQTGNGCQGVSTTNGLPTKAGTVTIVPLDIAVVTTGSTAVNALSAGHASAGGYIITANAAGICVDQVTTAGTVTGTPSTTTCVGQNTPYNLAPNAHAVSVNSTASTVSLAGGGLQ